MIVKGHFSQLLCFFFDEFCRLSLFLFSVQACAFMRLSVSPKKVELVAVFNNLKIPLMSFRFGYNLNDVVCFVRF